MARDVGISRCNLSVLVRLLWMDGTRRLPRACGPRNDMVT